jgi:hypothetical protein
MGLKYHYFFEWMDLKWIPANLRKALFNAFEFSLNVLRNYYKLIANEIYQEIKGGEKVTAIVEIGAGNCNASLELYNLIKDKNIKIIVCDINPNVELFKKIEKATKGKIKPIYHSVAANNASKYIPKNSLVFFSTSFHHFHKLEQEKIIKSFSLNSNRIMIFEAIKRNVPYIILASTLFIPILFLFPIVRPRLSHFFWCWLVPAVPFLLTWDGIVSCFRQNTSKEWIGLLKEIDLYDKKSVTLKETNTSLFLNLKLK